MPGNEARYLVSWSASDPAAGGRCPDENLLAAYAEAAAGEAFREEVESHLSTCSPCRDLVAGLAAARAAAEAGERAAGAAPEPAAGAGPAGGRTFGPYTLVRRLGAGGMGVVYEAVHSRRGRPEALKVLKGGLGSVPDFAERFQREVRATASLDHDHVVKVYDAGQVGEELYYTMPLLSGATLADVVREVAATGEFPPAGKACAVLDRHRIPALEGPPRPPAEAYCLRVAAALVGVADALASMHAAGILHRDIKPGNLMIDPRGRVLLADFGIVRWGDDRITRTGQSVGTPAYMSPEQVTPDGREPDGRTDLYALGATLFELLALRLPGEGKGGAEASGGARGRRAPPLRSIHPGVPEDLEVLVGRCLEGRREDRVPGAALLRDDLTRLLRGEPVRTQPVSRTTRALRYLGRPGAPLAAAAAVLLVAGGWYLARPAVLTVEAIPPARLFVDGVEVGTTPVTGHRLSRGRHEIRLERERFATFVREIEVERGSTFVLERGLQALDPADPEALRALAAAEGIEVSEVRVEATRGGPPGPPLAVLFPRGRVREAPARVRIWAAGASAGGGARLETDPGGELLAEWEVPATVGRRDLEVPGAARARMLPGGSYRIRLSGKNPAQEDSSGFSLLDAEGIRGVEEGMEGLGRPFPEGDPSVEFLRVEWLLGRRLYEEAYDRVVTLEERIGPRREVARTALAVLDRAGLRDRGWWADWIALHREAKR